MKEKGKVLVIENEEPWKTKLKKYLETAGFYVVIAENLDMAMEITQKEQFHFITIDMQLDNDNDDKTKFEGWDVLALLKKLHTQDMTPAMVITGFPDDYIELQRSKGLKSIFFMSKRTFDKAAFIKTVERAVASHDLRFKDDHRGD